MKNLSNYILTAALFALAALLWLGPALIPHAEAARENDVWVDRLGSYVESVFDEGRNVLINGSNKYLNFGTISGSTGYGFRDNGGDIQFKMSGGAWADLGNASVGDDNITPDNVLTTGQTDEYCLTYEATGTTWEWQVCGSGGGDSVSIDSSAVTDPDFVSTGDIDFVDTSNTITANINAGSIIETDLDGDVAPTDGDYLQYDSTGFNFTWRDASEVKTDLSLNSVENTALSTWAGTTNVTTLGAIVTGTWQATAVTDSYVSDTLTIGAGSTIADGLIIQADLNSDVTAVDGDYLQYDSTGDNFTWREASEVRSDLGLVIGTNVQAWDADLDTWAGVTPSANGQSLVSAANYAAMRTLLDLEAGTDFYSISAADAAFEGELNNEAGLYAALSDVTNFLQTGDALAGDDITDGSIDSSEIGDDVITHADIADSDQASTMCIYFEDPTATDDFKSIWANKTANNFLLTEIWAESDQTVNFDLQVDDGTPADVSGTDISPAAGEAEDTTLTGDTTLAAGEELDLAITSVSGTPTWVSICWTGNWVD